MVRIKKTKKDNDKEKVVITKVEEQPEIVNEIQEETKVEPIKEITTGKEYVVVLGTPAFYVIQLEDGTKKTIQGSNTYKRGDIVKL